MDWFEQVPKVELHLHREGAVPPPALRQLIEKYGGDPAVPNVAALELRFEYRDFRNFLEIWTWKNQYVREYEDFRLIAEAVARDLARQNVRYVEVFYSPADFRQHGLDVGPITEAIRAGVDRVAEIAVGLVAFRRAKTDSRGRVYRRSRVVVELRGKSNPNDRSLRCGKSTLPKSWHASTITGTRGSSAN